MNCPKCPSASLKPKSFNSPLYCENCGGMWIEFDKLPEFIKNPDENPVVASSSDQNDARVGFCPEGHGIMNRAKIDVQKPFYLEKCSSCGGIWFDNGELEKVLSSNLTHDINDFWCKSWQNKQRKEKDRETYLANNRRILGKEVFDQIIDLSKILKGHPDKGRALALLQQEIV